MLVVQQAATMYPKDDPHTLVNEIEGSEGSKEHDKHLPLIGLLT